MPTDSIAGLENLRVLVTRPRHQTEELCALIAASGAEAINFPVLEIVPLEDNNSNNHQHRSPAAEIIDQLDDVDIAVFISANAVEQGDARVRQQRGHWPAHIQLAVVGRGSAQALMRVGLTAGICPEHGFNSEALLALPAMHKVQGKRIVIFRGQGGRETLAAVLRQRGAQVEYVEVYQRRRPDINLDDLHQQGQLKRISAIIVASNESLQNLYDMAGTLYRDWLLNTPLAVISHRCAGLAEALGFHRYCIAGEVSNLALLEAVRECCAVTASVSGAETGNDRK
jgi:uroporphyrinogen-III synthase